MFLKRPSGSSSDSPAREQAIDRLRGLLALSAKEPSAADRAAKRWFGLETPDETRVVAEVTRPASEQAPEGWSKPSYSFKFISSFTPNGRG